MFQNQDENGPASRSCRITFDFCTWSCRAGMTAFLTVQVAVREFPSYHLCALAAARYELRGRESERKGAGADDYGTSMTGACQNAPFCPVGSNTVTWQSYLPGAS